MVYLRGVKESQVKRLFTGLQVADVITKSVITGNGGGDLNPWRRPRIEPLSA
jgi:hypothetical protein